MALIVVADDDVDIRDLVEFKLATLGHQILTVPTAAPPSQPVATPTPTSPCST